MAVALAKGERYAPRAFTLSDAEIAAIVERETRGLAPSQRYLRGYFTGGTLADEAWIVAHRATGAVHSNNQTDPALRARRPAPFGRPHGGRPRRRRVHRRPPASDDRPERARRADDGRARRRRDRGRRGRRRASATARTRTRRARSRPRSRRCARRRASAAAICRSSLRSPGPPATRRTSRCRRRSWRRRAASSCRRTTRRARSRPGFSSESARGGKGGAR